MQKFNLLCIIMLLTYSIAFAQQKVNVSGTVKDKTGQVLAGANVRLKGTGYGAVSENNGSFIIKDVPLGSYTVVFSYVGYIELESQIDVNTNMSNINIQLKKKTEELSEAIITETRVHPTEESLKLLSPLKDVPLTTSTVSHELIEQRQLSSLNDAMRYSTGISPSLNYGGFQTFKMRGFGGPVIMLDGARDERMNFSNSAPVTSLSSVDHIEYLKGPAAILYGHSAVGGILNIVRKKTSSEFGANFKASYGSWNAKEVSLGAGGSLAKKLDYRFDIGLSERDGWRDNGDKTFNAYIALDYKINKKNKLMFSFGGNDDFYGTETGIPVVKSDIYSASNDELLYSQGEHPAGYDREQRYNDPSDFLVHENYNLSGKYMHEFSETSKLQFHVSFAHDIIDYFSTEELSFLTSDEAIYDTYLMNGEERTYICLDTLQRTFPLRFSHHTNTYQNYLDYSFQTKTGNILHKLLVGYYLMYVDRISYKGYDLGNDVTGEGLFAKITFVNPVLNQGDLQTSFSGASIYRELINSFYTQDLLDILPNLKALLGARLDIYHMEYQSASVTGGFNKYDYSETNTQKKLAFTYRAGLVFQPTKTMSLYGSYANYFRPNRKSYNSSYIYLDKNGKEFTPEENAPFFEPQTGYQLEGGFKYNYSSKLQLNSSVFYIVKNNIVEYLGVNVDNTRIYGQVGVVSSKGFDVEAIASPVAGFKITAGYEKTIARYEDFSYTGYGENSSKDNYLSGCPQDRFFSWVYYNFEKGFARNFNIGIGFEYTGKKFVNSSNTYELPAYSMVDANIGYSFDKVFLKFALNNITDEEYFTGAIYSNQFIPGYGRNYKLTIGVNL